jgi:hypothetical protein
VAPERPKCRRRRSGIRQRQGVREVYRDGRHVEAERASDGDGEAVGLFLPAANDCTLRVWRSSQQGWPRSGMVAPGRCMERISRMGFSPPRFARRPAEKEVGALSFHAGRSSKTPPDIWGRTCSIESATRRRNCALTRLSRRRHAGSRPEPQAARPWARTLGQTRKHEYLRSRVSLRLALANRIGVLRSEGAGSTANLRGPLTACQGTAIFTGLPMHGKAAGVERFPRHRGRQPAIAYRASRRRRAWYVARTATIHLSLRSTATAGSVAT